MDLGFYYLKDRVWRNSSSTDTSLGWCDGEAYRHSNQKNPSNVSVLADEFPGELGHFSFGITIYCEMIFNDHDFLISLSSFMIGYGEAWKTDEQLKRHWLI